MASSAKMLTYFCHCHRRCYFNNFLGNKIGMWGFWRLSKVTVISNIQYWLAAKPSGVYKLGTVYPSMTTSWFCLLSHQEKKVIISCRGIRGWLCTMTKPPYRQLVVEADWKSTVSVFEGNRLSDWGGSYGMRWHSSVLLLLPDELHILCPCCG